ncbi:MAG: DNA polymerase, partial [Pontimonas sp.]
HSTHLLGANIQFDILYLRRFDPSFRLRLGGRQTLIDLTVLNYLHSEFREGSLKTLGETLGTHTYAETLKDGKRFVSPNVTQFREYAAADTHNTVLAASELGKRIRNDWPETDKGSRGSLDWYSQTLWTVIRMSESGVPMSSTTLDAMGGRMDDLSREAVLRARDEHGLLLEGPGCSQSKQEFLEKCIALVPEVLDHPMLEITEKTKKVSWSSGNRKLLASLLPPNSEEAKALSLVNQHQTSQKVLSAYLWPLLHHRRSDPFDRQSTLIPWPTTDTLLRTSSSAGMSTEPCTPLQSTTRTSAGSQDGSSGPTSTRPESMSGSSRASSAETCPETAPLSSYQTCWPKQPSKPTSRRTNPRRARPSDGAVYPTWYVVPGRYKESEDSGGTVQARITCKQPSAQTFPPDIKKAIASRWVGGTILWADLSQVEMRVAACLSGDTTLLRAFREGLDMHTERTVQLFGQEVLEDPDFKSTWRQVGKTINFADLFLASPQRMQQSAWEMTGRLIDLEVFEKAVKDRPHVRPGLWRWQQALLRQVDRTGTLHIPHTGQSRTFVGGSKAHVNTIVNFPVQTTAANATLAIQHELMNLLPSWGETSSPRILMCLQIYDSVCFDVPPGREDEAESLFAEAVAKVCSPHGYWGMMESCSGHPVPLTYEVTRCSPTVAQTTEEERVHGPVQERAEVGT